MATVRPGVVNYKYAIEYSLDGIDYTTIDHTDNILCGFTNDSVNFTARYVRITETGTTPTTGATTVEVEDVPATPAGFWRGWSGVEEWASR